MKKFNKKYIIGILIFIIFLIQSILYFQCVVDDSFITYRYGYNLVNYGYWNYNPDNNFTEAYTSALYAFLSIIPPLINLDVLIFFKFISIIVFSLFLITIYLLRDCFETKNKYLALAIILFNPAFFIHLYAGLETCLFVLLIFQLFLFLYFNKYLNWTLINIFLLPFVRPEGTIFSIVAIIYLLYYNSKRYNIKYLNIKILSIFVTWIIYFIWRYLYFKMLLPNPFYVKVTSNDNNIISNIITNFKGGYYYLIIILMAFIFFRNKLFRIFCVLSFLIFLFIYSPSTLAMDFAARFKFQVFFPLILCFILINNVKKAYIIKYLSLFVIISVPIFHFSYYLYDSIKNNYNLLFKYKEIGIGLNKFYDSNFKFMIGEAGIIPYYSNLCVFDLSGLANSYIARNGLTKEFLNKEKIDVVVEYSFNENRNLKDFLKSDFTKIDSVYIPGWNVYLNFYFKTSDINDYTKDKINSFKNKLERINKEEFDIYKYLKQEYIFD